MNFLRSTMSIFLFRESKQRPWSKPWTKPDADFAWKLSICAKRRVADGRNSTWWIFSFQLRDNLGKTRGIGHLLSRREQLERWIIRWISSCGCRQLLDGWTARRPTLSRTTHEPNRPTSADKRGHSAKSKEILKPGRGVGHAGRKDKMTYFAGSVSPWRK